MAEYSQAVFLFGRQESQEISTCFAAWQKEGHILVTLNFLSQLLSISMSLGSGQIDGTVARKRERNIMRTDYPVSYDPNCLIDRLQAHMGASDDHALALMLNLPLSLLEDLRAGHAPVSASLALMLESLSGLSVAELRRTMGDRRSYFRVATQHPCRNTRS